jgi:hypothetical protein
MGLGILKLGWFLLLGALPCCAECIPFAQAAKHLGEIRCVSGKVQQVKTGNAGVTYLDFCEDYRLCPFTVVVFARNLKDVGDVRQLAGKDIEVHGMIKSYDGRAEIILEQVKQLQGEAAKIPPLPKGYDVEQKGRYSAGKFSRPKTTRKTAKKKQPATMPVQIPEDTDSVD